MQIHFLKPLIKESPTKTFEYKDNKWVKTLSYPLMKHFKGIKQDCTDLKDFYEILKEAFNKSVFMIHGDFIQGTDLNKMIRGSRDNRKDKLPPTICDRMLDLFCVDIDDYIMNGNQSVPDTIEKFIFECLPSEFFVCDYVYQLSSSHGLGTNKLKCHLFFTPQEPIHNKVLYKWAQMWINTTGKKIIDPSVYKSVQPIYTQKRICLGKEDPVDNEDFIGYVNKGQPYLQWYADSVIEEMKSGPKIESEWKSEHDIEYQKNNLVNLKKNQDFDISESIRKIMSSEDYHSQIRSCALSLINKNVSAKDTRIFIQEFMQVAKQGIRDDPDRLVDWQNRYDDIQRAVESAVDIVDHPSMEDMLEWIEENAVNTIRREFAKKMISFSGVELKTLIRALDKKTDFGARAIHQDIKTAQEEKKEELFDIAKKLKSEERKAQNIFEIEITNSTYGSVTSSVCKILSQSEKKPEIYKLGNTLSVIESSIPKTIRQITKKGMLGNDYPLMPIVHDISSPVGVIRSRVEKDCTFMDVTGKEIVCPDSILNAVPRMYNVDWKPLSGIVEHPFIDDNWNLVEKDGYDTNTGLYACLHKKLKVKLIDPKKAYEYLIKEVFAEFPFQTDLDATAAIGMFMSAVQRPYVIGDHGMPGYAIVSPKPSSGKTTLAQLLSYSIYNRPVAATGWSDNDEELGKHLLAILREGHSCVLFDNIKKDAAIRSNELAKAMTSGTYSRRKLGSNETEEVPSSVLWLFTGNNIVFKGDFATRILPIRIVPMDERPEFRKFNRKDVGQWAMDNRKKIISAILSIVMVGKGIDHSKFEKASRFKEWNKFVRIPLLEISGCDILDIFDKNDFLDDETIAKGDLLELIHNTFEDRPFVTKDIMKLVEGETLGLGTVAADTTGSNFRHTIVEAFNEKAVINIKTLGRFILGMKDLILRGYMLVREEGLSVAKWRVIKMENGNDSNSN